MQNREGPDGLPRPGEEDDESRNPGIVAGPGQKGTESRGILGQNGRTQARAQWDTETIRHSIEGRLNKPIVHLAGEEGLPSDAIVVDALEFVQTIVDKPPMAEACPVCRVQADIFGGRDQVRIIR